MISGSAAPPQPVRASRVSRAAAQPGADTVPALPINRVFNARRYATPLMLSPSVPVTAALLLAAIPGAASGPASAQTGDGRLTQLIVRQQLLVRIQRPVAVTPIEWAEKKGPKCIAADDLAGVLIARADAVDLVLDGGSRLRARLDKDCPALNFYGGFYLKPNRDRQLCAGRDAIRSRSGRMCEIAGFKRLVAKR